MKELDIDIRIAESADAGDLLELYDQLLPQERLDVNKVKDFLENRKRDSCYRIYVAVAQHQVRATCTLIIIPNLTHAGHSYGIIENVVTLDLFRGNGYGQFLLRNVINHAKEIGCHKVMVQTRRKEPYVLEFYKKCGFSDELSTGFMIDLEAL